MRVFKFGGASVNSADAVRNMAEIVRANADNSSKLIVVVSAMGKTTNLLEQLVPTTATIDTTPLRHQLEQYHLDIATALMPTDDALRQKIRSLLSELDSTIARLSPSLSDYNYNYDQVVCFGELISTTIIAHYLSHHANLKAQWIDARSIVFTDNHHREGRVDWQRTEEACSTMIAANDGASVIVTQGFIGMSSTGTTTLGREGSDYSAAIIAHCLQAESVTIWKDVPGFLNADPKYFDNTTKISQIPYNEAIELAYYGASVIHPKTVKPLQNKAIPLYIRSFLNPADEGSTIGNYSRIYPEAPLFICKDNQILISIQPRDYSFIAEDNLQTIFGLLDSIGIRVNMMQNSALSFSICIDHHQQQTDALISRLKAMFHVRYNDHLQLITIRYFTPQIVDDIVGGRKILLEQRSRTTTQIVVPSTKPHQQ